jgi:hypothetical protein
LLGVQLTAAAGLAIMQEWLSACLFVLSAILLVALLPLTKPKAGAEAPGEGGT